MQDFTQNEIFIRTIFNERARATYGQNLQVCPSSGRSRATTDPARPTGCTAGLRASVASRLAALALAIDSEVARRRIDRQSPAGA